MNWRVSFFLFLCLGATGLAEPAGKPMDVPIPINHDFQGLRIPIYSPDGKLQMIFESEIAFRVDQQMLRLSGLSISTFDDDGQPEMAIEMPLSLFDLKTQVLTSEKSVMIRRPDVEVTGERLVFDTQSRRGKLSGQVRVRLLTRVKEDKP